MFKYKYFLPERGETADDCYEVELATDWDDRLDWVAEEAAQDYHDCHDGRERRWPIDITVIRKDGKQERYSVYRESQPVFSASKIKK